MLTGDTGARISNLLAVFVSLGAFTIITADQVQQSTIYHLNDRLYIWAMAALMSEFVYIVVESYHVIESTDALYVILIFINVFICLIFFTNLIKILYYKGLMNY